MSEQHSGDYYYADGKRIELTPSRDFVAVDQHRASSCKVSDGAQREIQESLRSRRGVAVVPAGGLVDQDRASLEAGDALLPIFEDRGDLLVVLPELRIEPGADKGADVERWLEGHRQELQSFAEQRGRWIVRPKLASGALHLANEAQEQLSVDAAQARMLRIVKRF
ncbi:MAG: hypothetical protein ACE37K_04105 [Planctomycetota bacterium]